ncbi:MAG: beta-ketoacyl-ACP synthase [Caldilineae bacterium]|nr:MAG: beta-ketoacyl-ACP synthase [Caldilineae bacterium]
MTNSWTVNRGLSPEGKECIDCHQDKSPGIVQDWKDSRHGHVNVSCIDCHRVEADSPMATQHETLVGTDVYISVLVPPSRCQACHPAEVDQFNHSGHWRSYRQQIPKDSLHALVFKHEGQSHPEFGNASNETGCIQCHGTEIKLDENNRPVSSTWPNAGMGNIYPDGSTGNCSTCHTRHKFSIAEARKPAACASCHLGPDHPDIEIYMNSKHGQIYNTEGDEWIWDSAPDAWEPGDYRAPTCATCHMSGIGELNTTHNVSERLYWNLWAKSSGVRNSNDVMSPLYGNGEEGRAKMKLVCNSCHSPLHTDGFFEQGDRAVQLYNVAYYEPAEKMRAELEEKGLLKENPWIDEFQIIYYHLWHHQGRRARQGAMMGGPDYAHWHGFFELQQDLYKLKEIYQKRIETGKIEE